MLLAALAAEFEPEPGASHFHVVTAERGQAIRLVVARVLIVPHPDAGHLQQPHDRREHLFAGKSRARDILVHLLANRRQQPAEREHAVELGVVPYGAVLGMVTVLLAAAGVAAGHLDMSVSTRADPDVGPGRGNHE